MGKKKEAKKSLLESRLAAVPPEASETLPSVPIAVALEEAYELSRRASKVRKQIVALPGFDAGALDGLPVLADALDAAEEQWRKGRLGQQGKPYKKLRKEAEQLRADVIASGRYLLRQDERAQRELDQIAEGEGLADLIQDLGDLGKFWDSHAAEFAHAVGLGEESRGRLTDLQVELRGAVDDAATLEAQAERNRRFAALVTAVAEVRAATRYLFRGNPEKLRQFASSYVARGNAKKRKPAAPAPAASAPASTTSAPASSVRTS